jgi:hemoglobin
MRNLKPLFAISVLSLTLAATLPAADEHKAPLYQRLGGAPAVHAVVEEFVGRILADPHVNGWFEHAAHDPAHAKQYKATLADFICAAAGGPCQYHGKDMVTAHKDRHVTPEAFDIVAHHLAATLDHLKVNAAEKNELMTLVGGLKPAIVGH